MVSNARNASQRTASFLPTCAADQAVALILADSVDRKLLQYELEIAIDERKKRGLPLVRPVWFDVEPTEDGPFGVLARNLLQPLGPSSGDSECVIAELRAALSLGQSEKEAQRLDLRVLQRLDQGAIRTQRAVPRRHSP